MKFLIKRAGVSRLNQMNFFSCNNWYRYIKSCFCKVVMRQNYADATFINGNKFELGEIIAHDFLFRINDLTSLFPFQILKSLTPVTMGLPHLRTMQKLMTLKVSVID